MDQLFSTEGEFKIVRLGEQDACGLSDHLRDFSHLILQNEPMYPGIDKWLSDKVIPGIRDSQRAAYVGYVDGIPAASAVVKCGESSKFCHLRIREDLQNKHLGEAFFCLMGLEAREAAREIHFTVPESVWEKEKKFFTSFGFDRVVKTGHQYRLFENELRCSAPFHTVWQSILEKLPKIARAFSVNGCPFNAGMLMSIKPEHAASVLSGNKRVELRRRFSTEWTGCRVSIYASHPRCSIVGDALMQEVVVVSGPHLGTIQRPDRLHTGAVRTLRARGKAVVRHNSCRCRPLCKDAFSGGGFAGGERTFTSTPELSKPGNEQGMGGGRLHWCPSAKRLWMCGQAFYLT